GYRPMRDTLFSGLLREVLDAAIAVDGAVAGAIQRLDRDAHCLRFAVARGLPDAFVARYAEIPLDAPTSCAQALRERRCVVIRDVRVDPTASAWKDNARDAGFAAVQSTPLKDGARRDCGVLNTHFDQPHHPAT